MKNCTHVRVQRPSVLRQSIFILDKKLMEDFMMYISTSVACWLMSNRVFLYLLYFSFAFLQFFGFGLLQSEEEKL